jgi:protocatechuate 3,4-dioxygenase, beta subunit
MGDVIAIESNLARTQPEYHFPGYVSSIARSPRMPLVVLPRTLTECTGPMFGHGLVREGDNDLTAQHSGGPLGERIFVHGRVLDDDGRPVRGALVEIWQANAAGRYRHKVDGHDAPLDPNFSGAGRMLTDADGRY